MFHWTMTMGEKSFRWNQKMHRFSFGNISKVWPKVQPSENLDSGSVEWSWGSGIPEAKGYLNGIMAKKRRKEGELWKIFERCQDGISQILQKNTWWRWIWNCPPKPFKMLIFCCISYVGSIRTSLPGICHGLPLVCRPKGLEKGNKMVIKFQPVHFKSNVFEAGWI